VVANATTLPFNDGSFKYAVAHMSAMNYKEEKYSDEEYLTYVEDVLKEVARVLEPDGQFRFTDTAISDEDLRHGENDKIPEKSNEYTEWRMEREYRVLKEMAERAGFRELRVEKYSDSHPEKDEYLLTHYYVALR
jgi:SAM-dependent methyltransferase